jgi:IclR family pca regulon transcriptional regulator
MHEIGRERSRYAVRALERGLALLQALGNDLHDPTLAEVSAHLGLHKPSAFRLLATLQALGYVEQDVRTKRYRLGLRVLDLGYSYLASRSFPEQALPFIEALARQCDEAASLAVLDGPEIVYVARAATNRVMSSNLRVGSRLPAYCASLGKALLAFRPDDETNVALACTRFEALTPNTLMSEADLREQLALVRRRGYAINNEETEPGLISAAAPVFDASGVAIAAINVSTSTGRVSVAELEARFVPHLLRTATEVSRTLGYRGDHSGQRPFLRSGIETRPTSEPGLRRAATGAGAALPPPHGTRYSRNGTKAASERLDSATIATRARSPRRRGTSSESG